MLKHGSSVAVGVVYLKKEYERIILRHYSVNETEFVNAVVRDRLQEDDLLNSDGEYTPDGAEPVDVDAIDPGTDRATRD